MRRAVVLALGLVLLAGCGGGSSKPPTGAAVAARISCTNPKADSSTELFVSDATDCTYHGQSVTIDTFQQSGSQAQWEQVAKGFSDGQTAVGKGFVVEANTASQASAIAKVIGGKTI